MSKYRRKKVLFVCIGNACRSPMAEAIARVDASAGLDAFSAGLAPVGFVTESTKQTLRRNGCWVEDLESKSISPEVWEHVDIVINMTGRPRELTFDDCSKVEDWNIEDPYGKDPGTHQRVFEEIRLRVAMLAQECWLQPEHENGEKDSPVPLGERRARGRWYPASPILMELDGGKNARVLNLSEGGLALSATTILSDLPLHNLQVQFLDSPHPLEVRCQAAWKSESQKEVGIQFVGLTQEARKQIRNWISVQASANIPPGQSHKAYEKQNPVLEVPHAPQSETMVAGALASAKVNAKHEKAWPFPAVAVPASSSANPPLTAARTYPRTGISPKKSAFGPGWRLAVEWGNFGVLRRRWGSLVILGSLIGLVSWTVQSVTIQHNPRNETTSTATEKPAASRQALKPGVPSAGTTTPSLPNPQADKMQVHGPVVEPMPLEEAERIVKSYQDLAPKHSPRRHRRDQQDWPHSKKPLAQ